jgi:hypothetical protein
VFRVILDGGSLVFTQDLSLDHRRATLALVRKDKQPVRRARSCGSFRCHAVLQTRCIRGRGESAKFSDLHRLRRWQGGWDLLRRAVLARQRQESELAYAAARRHARGLVSVLQVMGVENDDGLMALLSTLDPKAGETLAVS